MQKNNENDRGFSLIEILVSVAIFSVVVITGTLSIMTIIDSNQKSQSLNSVMSNLNIALESMSREVRLGTDYGCPDTCASADQETTEISFIPDRPLSDTHRVNYRFNSTTGLLERFDSVNDTAFTPVTADEVVISDMKFVVHSSGQPSITLTLKGKAETRAKTSSTFYLQTLMSQRPINDPGYSVISAQ